MQRFFLYRELHRFFPGFLRTRLEAIPRRLPLKAADFLGNEGSGSGFQAESLWRVGFHYESLEDFSSKRCKVSRDAPSASIEANL
jgi:hypothetical protein